ncbi:MAG: hypothetical protein GEU75_08870 [Dehalococcoidia bacterium]|nr:hypothetical protein [Dehalococcoidia bacterium]
MKPKLLATFVLSALIPLALVAAAGPPAVSLALQAPEPQTLTFYLHGDDVLGTADGSTMNATPSSGQTLQVNLADTPSWYSDPPLTGSFAEGASFTLVKPCTVGLSLTPTYTLALTNADGNEIEQLGQTTQLLGLCLGQERVRIPVQTPVELEGQRLKLTISTTAGLNVDLSLGRGTYLEATNFVESAPELEGALVLSASIEGQLADTPPGPDLTVGDRITLDVGVTNVSEAEARIREATTSFGPMTCDAEVLSPGQSMTCSTTGTVLEGPQEVPITVTGISGGQGIAIATNGFYTGVLAHLNRIVTVDSEDTVGLFTSLVLDADGRPHVSYLDFTFGRLMHVHCGNANCSGANPGFGPVAGGVPNNVQGLYSSLALDSSGNPVISHYDATAGDLTLTNCANPDCNAALTPLAGVDATGDVGQYTSLAITPGGGFGGPEPLLLVSYYDSTNTALKMAICDVKVTLCSSFTYDAAGNVGQYTSVASNGKISYYDSTNRDLKLAWCTGLILPDGKDVPACVLSEVITVDDVGDVGQYTSLALDAAGNPVISYYDSLNTNLRVAHCGNPRCSANNSLMVVDVAGDVGLHTSLALDADGNPVVSYYDATNGDLKLLHCGDPTCNPAFNSIVTVDSAGDVGQYSSLALDAAGRPVISYYDATNGDLKVAHCTTPTCD